MDGGLLSMRQGLKLTAALYQAICPLENLLDGRERGTYK